ncbi:endo-1,4-beta-xylanase [Actinotalea ferrariae]|uniref:endo-1,4-beta-xylanase n=1 Tax=Actinotalea ferrariae TaxID=1386098 RepID=UPI001C8CDACD|nr:endo-1,4-beta-xylanase [Actinotalea ferrariae]MBX9243448.1 endo-1,4-beta-xylanase [Actinotalea ferrariae]
MHSSPTPDPTLAHRTAEATVTVLRADGTPLADADVVVAQTRHAFGFGNIGFEFIPLANDELSDDGASPARPAFGEAEGTRLSRAESQHLADLWLDVFNTATLPFYWGRFEPERGRPDTERLRRTAQWFVDRGVAVKGHPLMWHTVQPDWLLGLPTDEVERLQRERIRREVSDMAGLIDTWDAINEVVIMPVFDNGDNAITPLARRLGRIATIRLAFDEARAANPSATLLLNDFDMSTAYECLIEGVLEAGVQVDVLGLQSHMHQGYWGEEKTLEVLDRFSRYGLPIHLTESTLLSGHLMPPELDDLNDYQIPDWPSTPEGEARQADEVERHYRTLLSHPSVQAVTYWGLSDVDSWLGAPGGFVRADGTPKPSYDALRRLVKDEWWVAPTTLRTDAEGRVAVRGWSGDYEVRAHRRAATVTLESGGTTAVTATLA